MALMLLFIKGLLVVTNKLEMTGCLGNQPVIKADNLLAPHQRKAAMLVEDVS